MSAVAGAILARLSTWTRDLRAARLVKAGRHRELLARAGAAEDGSAARLELLAMAADACMRSGEFGEAQRVIAEVCGSVASSHSPERRYVKLYCRHLLAIIHHDESQLRYLTVAAAKLDIPSSLRRKLPIKAPKFRARIPPSAVLSLSPAQVEAIQRAPAARPLDSSRRS